MFAVPGWNVSANALKQQPKPSIRQSLIDSTGRVSNKAENKSKKRKQGPGPANGTNITEENLADLWSTHIEGKKITGKGGRERKKKKRRTEEKITGDEAAVANSHAPDTIIGGSGDTREGTVNYDGEQEPRESAVIPLAEAVGRDDSLRDANGGKENEETNLATEGRLDERKRRALERKRKKALVKAQTSGMIPPSRPAERQDAPNSKSLNMAKPTSPLPKVASSENSKSPPHKAIIDTSKSKPASESSHSNAIPRPPAQPSLSKLTLLQQSMQSKLISARFRHLNQALYTHPSSKASQLFAETPSAFASYHAGFRAQVAVWPQNPVDIFVEDAKARGKVGSGRDSQKKLWRQEKKGKGKGKPNANNETSNPNPEQDLEPLPRTRGVCTLADLGCGDASFAASLNPLSKPLHLRLHSFDLAQGDGPNGSLITVADIAKLPLADGSIDVAVICLALMGTNWIEFVEEAGRVVRWGGECWVTEIKSRFGRPAAKTGSIGKKKKGKEDEDDEVILEVEEETLGKETEKTDVGAFVEVWRRRGFELKGEVDAGNKMFVRMRFVRKLVPTRGKGVPHPPPAQDPATSKERNGDRGNGRYRAKKFRSDGRDGDEEDEGKVLKACVYKSR